MAKRTIRLNETYAILTALSTHMWRKPAKVEYQMIFLLPGTSAVSGLWARRYLICTQRTILAFAAKMHNEYEVLTLCIKVPDGNTVHEVYYWCKGEVTTNWGNLPKR